LTGYNFAIEYRSNLQHLCASCCDLRNFLVIEGYSHEIKNNIEAVCSIFLTSSAKKENSPYDEKDEVTKDALGV
jgi:hypothetical protein